MTSSIRMAISIALFSALAVSTPAQQERPEPPLRTVTWQCEGNAEIVATYLEGNPPMVRVELGDSFWTLPLAPSDSGSKYSDGTVTLWTHGNEATFDSPNLSTRCVFVDPAASTQANLEGTSWRLVAFVREGVRRELPDGVKIDATFKDGRVTGKGVCNRYFASYTIGEYQSLDVGDVGATMMMCPEYAEIESAYFANLSHSTRFAIGGDDLTITTNSGSLTFTKSR